jgi:Pyruvate/2-oxoacid:ferredoxin oxidoreductase delta subunit
MAKRKIVRIDEEKCDGCGLCVPSCAEGAIEITQGKARLVSEKFCDGLGACLGECPQGAISIEEREAEEFNEKAVEAHLSQSSSPSHSGCPSARVLEFESDTSDIGVVSARSQLTHWPVKLKLVPPKAPYLKNAHLLVCADCVPFVYAPFHQELLKGRVVLTGCPMLDDAESYIEKMNELFRANDLRSLTVAHVEVPCCFGLKRIVEQALKNSGKDISVQELVVGVKGELKRI